MKKFSFSVAVLGASGSGKTSLVKRFISNEIVETYDPTVHEVYEKRISLSGKQIKLRIKDTAGQEQVAGMFSSIIQSTDAFIIVYSIRSQNSLEKAIKLLSLIQSIKGNQVARILVSSCCDSEYREVPPTEGFNVSAHYNCSFAEISSLLNMNCHQVFDEVLSQLLYLEEGRQMKKRTGSDKGLPCCIM